MAAACTEVRYIVALSLRGEHMASIQSRTEHPHLGVPASGAATDSHPDMLKMLKR
jgi:hypothetical protein